MLLLLVVVLPILLLLTLRLGSLSRMRRNISTLIQGVSAILIVVALAEPAFVFPDPHLSMVVVLDASGSVSPSSRAASIQYARDVLHTSNAADTIRFVAVGNDS